MDKYLSKIIRNRDKVIEREEEKILAKNKNLGLEVWFKR
jgi:hypothetical protein